MDPTFFQYPQEETRQISLDHSMPPPLACSFEGEFGCTKCVSRISIAHNYRCCGLARSLDSVSARQQNTAFVHAHLFRCSIAMVCGCYKCWNVHAHSYNQSCMKTNSFDEHNGISRQIGDKVEFCPSHWFARVSSDGCATTRRSHHCS